MNSADLRFSIVMPAYNAAATIDSSIRSVLHQTVREFELLVVDDGSTDDTRERVCSLASDPRVQLLTQPNRGPAAARNRAIAAARAPLVSMIDADDLWLPTYLEAMAAAFEADPEAGLAYTDAWVLSQEGRVRRRTAMGHGEAPPPRPRDPKLLLLELLDGNFIYTAATVPRAVLEEVGGYDERFFYGEDFELWVRIVESGRPVVRTPALLAIHRKSDSSLTSDVRKFYSGKYDVYATIVAEHPLEAEALQIATRRRDWWAQQRRSLDHPGVRRRLANLARPVKRRLMRRRDWLAAPPPAVQETLEACRP